MIDCPIPFKNKIDQKHLENVEPSKFQLGNEKKKFGYFEDKYKNQNPGFSLILISDLWPLIKLKKRKKQKRGAFSYL